VSPGAATAVPRDDSRTERERVRREQAELAAQVDVLQADEAEVSAALDALQANVAAREAQLADAQRVAEEAAAAAAQAKAEVEAKAAELAELEQAVRDLAVRAYTSFGTDDAASMLEAGDISTAVQRQAMLDYKAGTDADAVDQLRAAREDLELRRQAADEAVARAEEQRAAVDSSLREVEAARDQQSQVVDEVETRLDAALAEAASLASLDQALSNRITQEQAALAAQARAAGSGSGGSSGGSVSVGNIDLTTVRGITVNVQIADELGALMAAAEADGMNFAGGGYRNPAAQIRLRAQNCPSASSPPSACSPPTARPGQSMHEQGLAVDFTYNGSLIQSRSNPGFQWLAANAGSFGFKNLPSEPWHWSINGN